MLKNFVSGGASRRVSERPLLARPAVAAGGSSAAEVAPKRHAQTAAPRVSFGGLLTNRLLTALPEEDFARLLPHLEPVTLRAGENVTSYGERIHFAYFPETAVLSHIYVLEDGGMAEAALIGREGMAGLSAVFGSAPPIYSTQVTVAGSALRVRIDALRREFQRGAALQRLLLAYAGMRVLHVSQRAVCNGRHTVERRLNSWLLMVHDRTGDVQLPLTHEQIAAHLGARRAGITSAAMTLRDRGVVSYTRGHIHILDRRALEESACECYRVLRQLKLDAHEA